MNGAKLPFSPVPEPGVLIKDGLVPKDHADELGWNTSFDLEETNDSTPDHLPVLHYLDSLDTVSRKIASAAKTVIEESGTNMLYLVFGFLEWYESDDSLQSHLAPLIVVPVRIERIGGKGRTLETVVEYADGEDVSSNLSLVEKMRRDFGIDIPRLDDEDTPESYFERFRDILDIKPTWKIRPQITLAMLSFGKLLMYRDLDPKNWPKNQNIAKHAIVRELFEGTKNTEIAFADEYSIDAPEVKLDVPPLILDADSSQHSALIHALRGHNLVIEGPPGTGKSQTITNLIAAALAKGKTVLFVSEKLAALEVVRSRLDDAGLGVFCLELHSHKTKKGALLKDIAQRYKLRGTFRDPQSLDRHMSEVEQKKHLLTQYSSLINKRVEPIGETVFEILWAREGLSQKTEHYKDEIGQLLLPSLVNYSQEQFIEAEQFLVLYSQHLFHAMSSWSSIEKHPWAWLSRDLEFEEEERLMRHLESLLELISRSNQCCEDLQSSTGIVLDRSERGLLLAANTLSLLPERGAAVCVSLLETCRSAANRLKLSEFLHQVEMYDETRKELHSFAAEPDRFGVEAKDEELRAALESLREWKLERETVSDLYSILEIANKAEREAEKAASSFAELLSNLGIETDATVTTARYALEAGRILESTPTAKLYVRQISFEAERTEVILNDGKERALRLKNKESELKQRFDLGTRGSAYDSGELSRFASIIEDSSLLKRIFGAEYRKAIKIHRQLSLTDSKVSRRDRCDDLRSIAEFLNQRSEFECDPVYQTALSSHFRGADSPWDDALAIARWYQCVLIAFPQHHSQAEPFRSLLLSGRTEVLRTIQARGAGLKDQSLTIEGFLERVSELSRRVPSRRILFTSGDLDDITKNIRELVEVLSAALKSVVEFTILPDFSFDYVPSLLQAAGKYRKAGTTALACPDVPKLIGSAYAGLTTDLSSLRATLKFAESLANEKFQPTVAIWLLCNECDEHLKALTKELTQAVEWASEIHSSLSALHALTGAAFWCEDTSRPLAEFAARIGFALEHSAELGQWIHFLRLRQESKERGLERLTSKGDVKSIKANDLPVAFRFVFYNTLSRSAFSEHPYLGQASGITQETLRKQFAESDKEAIRLFRERAAAAIDRRPLPFGNQSGPVKTWTDMALIQNEINKQMRHIPIRQLLLRSAKALVALKPCFMMGPLSVAQYLAPGELKFDLVVMDEASQLKPEDSIGAIARGGQIVIVGDPKQLPPTNFFQRVSLGDDEEQDESLMAVEEGESILDVASSLFQPVRRLRWHYRSGHHSLIAFSNQEFYQRDLIIFPSAYHDHVSLGVKHHFVQDGVFESGRNPREAAVVVDAVLEHMRENPQESLGVVTLNFEQRELMEELLDKRLREDPAAVAFQEKMTGGQHSLFVKNLENVQGDERDVIFISTTYGLDSRGNQYQRFGPITGATGHRRLNVLFTRAKKRVVVFSSLDPERIQTSASSPWGVRALKQYLTYARTGILQQADDGTEQPTNDFENSVGTILKEKGYEVVPQVGVAGFFIDLAVKHPAKEGAFLLGIECDGATYHSARSARDRDRLREEILVNLGWKIHRIWSTDWFKSRDREIGRLLRKVQDLLDKDPAYKQQQQISKRKTSLRDRLIELRDTEIALSFPNTPLEKCLLGPDLLDELSIKRPKNRDDWFRRVPQQFRTMVESQQVARFLDRVLQIISDAE